MYEKHTHKSPEVLGICSQVQRLHASTPTSDYIWESYLEDLDNPDLRKVTFQRPRDFDQRCYYYNSLVPLTTEWSGPPHDQTDEEKDIQKCNEWRLTDLENPHLPK